MQAKPQKDVSQEFLDSNQYSLNSILRYERIFGHTWVSTGGEKTTKDFCLKLTLKPGQKVLDIGCGSGGSAFYMARQYGCFVHGIDLSSNMINLAKDRHSREEKLIKGRITFETGDILAVNYPSESFDVIYSRDTILHIAEKARLFSQIFKWLKPGGRLLITDYMKGDKKHSEEFIEYVNKRGYILTTVSEYKDYLLETGFQDVEATDMSPIFRDILKEELKYFIPSKQSFIQDFSEKDYDEIVNGWNSKIGRVEAGDQAWGLFVCRKGT